MQVAFSGSMYVIADYSSSRLSDCMYVNIIKQLVVQHHTYSLTQIELLEATWHTCLTDLKQPVWLICRVWQPPLLLCSYSLRASALLYS